MLQPLAQPCRGDETRYVSFRDPLFGLNNQVLELVGMVGVAKALGRTLVLPSFMPGIEADRPAELHGRVDSRVWGRDDGYEVRGEHGRLPFAELFDEPRFRAHMAGFVCLAEPGEVVALDAEPGGAAMVAHGDLRSLSWFRGVFGAKARDERGRVLRGADQGEDASGAPKGSLAPDMNRDYSQLKHIHFVRPEGLSHYFVDLEGSAGGPALQTVVEAALAFSPRVVDEAQAVTDQLMRASGGQGFLGVHMRVETDWMEFCVTSELQHGRALAVDLLPVYVASTPSPSSDAVRKGTYAAMPGVDDAVEDAYPLVPVRKCFSSAEVQRRVNALPAARALNVVFVAVGEDLPPGNENAASAAAWGRDGVGQGVFTSHALAPHLRKLPYTLQAAVDMEVCSRATLFVGSSWSTFANRVARQHAARGRPTYIYNAPPYASAAAASAAGPTPSPPVARRTDGGWLMEPYDAVLRPRPTNAIVVTNGSGGDNGSYSGHLGGAVERLSTTGEGGASAERGPSVATTPDWEASLSVVSAELGRAAARRGGSAARSRAQEQAWFDAHPEPSPYPSFTATVRDDTTGTTHRFVHYAADRDRARDGARARVRAAGALATTGAVCVERNCTISTAVSSDAGPGTGAGAGAEVDEEVAATEAVRAAAVRFCEQHMSSVKFRGACEGVLMTAYAGAGEQAWARRYDPSSSVKAAVPSDAFYLCAEAMARCHSTDAGAGATGVGRSMAAIAADTTTDKVSQHGYHRVYPLFLEHLRTLPIKFLEIGLLQGSSLELWREYFPLAQLDGIDIAIHPRCARQPCRLGPRVRLFQGDASDESFVLPFIAASVRGAAAGAEGEQWGGAPSGGDEHATGAAAWSMEAGLYDVVVDDGSHVPQHQLAALRLLFTHALKPGGVYIVEDVETSYWTDGLLYGQHIHAGAGRSGSAMEVLKKLGDAVNAEFFDPSFDPLPPLGSLVSSVTFGHNCVVLVKKQEQGEAAAAPYEGRTYRMRRFVWNYASQDVEPLRSSFASPGEG